MGAIRYNRVCPKGVEFVVVWFYRSGSVVGEFVAKSTFVAAGEGFVIGAIS